MEQTDNPEVSAIWKCIQYNKIESIRSDIAKLQISDAIRNF